MTVSQSGFSRTARLPVPSLALDLETWRHPCGAVHYHLACADEHRAFMVALRTPPGDSSGLPHILEHTTLCGSRRYPVRDPFFNMLRRSLQTFMNAMTFPDLTAYPFATQVEKDWRNLLDVYLDAVFAPVLHPLDFAQEGHRLSPKAPAEGAADGAPTTWERQGVVFNEMKGAMDSTDSQVEAAAAKVLFPDTIYAHNSGGEPTDIPTLTHADLVAFHRRCYRPANAVFITYGNGDPQELHAALGQYLVDPGEALPVPTAQQPLATSQELDVPVPWAEGQDELDVSSTAVTWAWGDVSDIDEVLTAELLDRLLLGHAGAPLRHALESSGIGRSAGSSGYGASYRNGQFTVELDGVPAADYGKLPALAEQVLSAVARDGLPAEEVAAALHQVELSRREIHGDHYPYGLELCFRLLTPWNLGVDPLPFLDQGPAIARLRERAATPGWLAGQVRARFIDHPHRLWVRAVPDKAWHARRQQAETAQTAAAVDMLDAAGLAKLREEAAALATRQATKDDPSILPDLELSDVPKERHWVSGTDKGGGLTVFRAGTNGLLHLTAALPLPALTPRELDLLPLATQCLGNLGVGERTYSQWSAHLNAVCGGLWAWSDLSVDPEDAGTTRAWLFAEVKGLSARHGEFLPLLHEAFTKVRHDEHERLAELVDQALSGLQDRITRAGSQLAGRAAMRGFGGAAGLSHRFSGLGRLAWLKETSDSIEEHGAGALAEELAALTRKLATIDPTLALIGDSAERGEVIAAARAAWPASGAARGPAFAGNPPVAVPATAFTTATAVNYCALAFPVVPLGHPDAAALSVAGRVLTHQVLHPKLREQGGAYGGGASYQGGSAVFSLTSYRDPRLEGTYTDMRDSLRWLHECPDDPRLMKEAVLGVLASLDAPGSPAGECRSRFSGDLKGTGPARLNAYRAAILRVTGADVRAAAARHLPPEGGVAAVISGTEAAKRIGWETVAL